MEEVFLMDREPLARGFYYPGNDTGCLLVHGFTGSPAEMRPLGEALKEEGYTVLGIRLKGHGENVESMAKTGHKDWIASVEEGYNKLKKETKKVFVMGLSMGGILSLNLAQREQVAGVISLAAPIRVFNRLAHFSPVLKYFMTYYPPGKKDDEDERTTEPEITGDLLVEYIQSYNRVPVNCVHELLILMRKTRKGLGKIKCPALVIQSRNDNVVKPISADIIYSELGTDDKKIVWLEESGHIITADCEREQVFKEVKEFIASHK